MLSLICCGLGFSSIFMEQIFTWSSFLTFMHWSVQHDLLSFILLMYILHIKSQFFPQHKERTQILRFFFFPIQERCSYFQFFFHNTKKVLIFWVFFFHNTRKILIFSVFFFHTTKKVLIFSVFFHNTKKVLIFSVFFFTTWGRCPYFHFSPRSKVFFSSFPSPPTQGRYLYFQVFVIPQHKKRYLYFHLGLIRRY